MTFVMPVWISQRFLFKDPHKTNKPTKIMYTINCKINTFAKKQDNIAVFRVEGSIVVYCFKSFQHLIVGESVKVTNDIIVNPNISPKTFLSVLSLPINFSVSLEHYTGSYFPQKFIGEV